MWMKWSTDKLGLTAYFLPQKLRNVTVLSLSVVPLAEGEDPLSVFSFKRREGEVTLTDSEAALFVAASNAPERTGDVQAALGGVKVNNAVPSEGLKKADLEKVSVGASERGSIPGGFDDDI